MSELVIKCGSCNKPITNKTEVEYSEEYSTFYCNFNCALEDFFDRARCTPIDFHDKQSIKEKQAQIKKGIFHWKLPTIRP